MFVTNPSFGDAILFTESTTLGSVLVADRPLGLKSLGVKGLVPRP